MPDLPGRKPLKLNNSRSSGNSKNRSDDEEEDTLKRKVTKRPSSQDRRGSSGSSKSSNSSKVARRPTSANHNQNKSGSPSRNSHGHQFNLDDDDDENEENEDDDEIIQAAVRDKGNNKGNNMIFIVGAVLIVIIVIAAFLLFGKGKDEPSLGDGSSSSSSSTSSSQDTSTQNPSSSEPATPDGVGIQDFLQDTNNISDSPLTDPEEYVKDIQGLTTRVDYEVQAITSAVDFVNYTKHRGTWGGGLELYWLDCTYKDTKYVIQVPFKYYKELDVSGIVPVKMELLSIKEPTQGDLLSIISYMELDEATLQTVLKANQKK